MMNNLALVHLKTGQVLVSRSEELEYEPKVHLIEPYSVSGQKKITLTPWPPYTDDGHILLNSNDLLTVCEPTPALVESYAKKVGADPASFIVKEEDQKVLLNEDGGDIPSEDGYEPEYIEEPDTSW